MSDQELFQETRGLLAGIGFRLVKGKDNFSIVNKAGKPIANGNLQTMNNTAKFMVEDIQRNPEKYEAMNRTTSDNVQYECGLAMGKKLQGK